MSAINKDLLAAAKDVIDSIWDVGGVTTEKVERCEQAIAAAERERAERLNPVDEEWLRSIGYGVSEQGNWWLFGCVYRVKSAHDLWWIQLDDNDVCLKNKGQLLDLLSGLGIEVKHDA